ncbi:MAG: hypothetical protein Q4F75_04660 [Pseudomonadota bacterium]|nr:hypothetical protein [Pseudomonadota bacterium]
MKIEVINGQETVASWMKRHYETVSREEDIVAWWKSKTYFGTTLQPARVFTILRQCDNLELKALRNYLQEKVEASQFLKPQYQRELNAVNDYCRKQNIKL